MSRVRWIALIVLGLAMTGLGPWGAWARRLWPNLRMGRNRRRTCSSRWSN